MAMAIRRHRRVNISELRRASRAQKRQRPGIVPPGAAVAVVNRLREERTFP